MRLESQNHCKSGGASLQLSLWWRALPPAVEQAKTLQGCAFNLATFYQWRREADVQLTDGAMVVAAAATTTECDAAKIERGDD